MNFNEPLTSAQIQELLGLLWDLVVSNSVERRSLAQAVAPAPKAMLWWTFVGSSPSSPAEKPRFQQERHNDLIMVEQWLANIVNNGI